MKTFMEIVIGVIVIMWILIYVLPDFNWVERPSSKGTVCSYQKSWFELPDERNKRCFMYWESK